MNPIVCAIRGGAASRRTQEAAIALARERQAPLVFLYVENPCFAEGGDPALEEAVCDELRRLGRALLGIAQARARERGVEAAAVVRFGPLVPTLVAFLHEVKAQTLVIGESRQQVADRSPTLREQIAQAALVEVVSVP